MKKNLVELNYVFHLNIHSNLIMFLLMMATPEYFFLIVVIIVVIIKDLTKERVNHVS